MLVANGPSPTAFLWRFPLLLTSLVFPSVALAAVNAVSVKQWMCEEKRACVCSCMYCAACGCISTQRRPSCCLNCCLVMELATVFLFIPPPAVTVVSGACLLNSGPWDTWIPVKSTNPSNNAECYSPEHTQDSCFEKQKARNKCTTFTDSHTHQFYAVKQLFYSFIYVYSLTCGRCPLVSASFRLPSCQRMKAEHFFFYQFMSDLKLEVESNTNWTTIFGCGVRNVLSGFLKYSASPLASGFALL